MARTSYAAVGLLGLASLSFFACGPSRDANGPRAGDTNALAKMTAQALEIEATHPATEALDAWEKVLKEARETRGTPLAREAGLAAIDAISGREVVGLESLGEEVGLAARVVDGERKAAAILDETLASDGARDPMIHAAAAAARMKIAAVKGDVKAFAAAVEASGCATEATIVGPFVGPSLGALNDPGPVDGGALQAGYPAPATAAAPALALATKPVSTSGRSCSLDITGTSSGGGLRYVVIDVDVPEAQTISVGLETKLPAQLLVGGKPAVSVAYGEIATTVIRFGHVEVKDGGTVRLVVKLGAYSPDAVVVYALAQDGSRLASHPAAVGAAPSTPIGRVEVERPMAPPASLEGRVTLALGLLAAGEAKRAEWVIAEVAHPVNASAKTKPPASAALVWARTLRFARDLPEFRRLERYRAAYDAALEGWPTSWEAIIGHAQIVALQRRGGAGEVEAISDTKKRRDAKGVTVDPLVDAFLAFIGDDVYGVKEESLARVKPVLAGTRIGWKLERETSDETDDVAAKLLCDPVRPDVSGFGCMYAKQNLGDYKGALAELQRLRVLYAAPKLGADSEMFVTMKMSGVAAARALYDKADLSDRSSNLAVEVMGPGKAGFDWLRRELRLLDGDARTLTEVINARRAAGDASAGGDLALPYEAKTKMLVAADKANKARPEVGTLILDREEKYELDAEGYLHAVVWDVRRLSGTTDVEANASARVASTSGGRGYIAQTVHRIFKPDGSVVEPDRIMAAQAGADLSQIEPGDYVELVAEGWFLARADGTFDLDTADLLPQRTAVAHASIALTLPNAVPTEVWSHSELGKAAVTEAAGSKQMVWTLKDHDVRRSEKGQAFLDASVAVRLATWDWKKLGRDAREGLLSEEERNFEVSSWVAAAVGNDKAPTVDLLARLEKAAKRTLPRIGFLPLGGGEWGMQTYNARTVLLDAQGSRVALIRRALDEIGVKNEVVWAEQAPYSADPKMVARSWRFTHALLVAWVAQKAGGALEPVWLDLDVEGYPPPPGRTSPELRGRLAINTKGEIIPVPPNAAEDPDTATIDVTVDDAGRAKGTIALLLRGRDAQEVSSVLEEEAGDERDELLRDYVLAWVPGADVTEVKASAETWQVLLTAKIEVPAMLVPDGKRFAIAGSPPLHGSGRASTLGNTYASLAKRKTALTIQNAILYSTHRVIHLPAGTAIGTPLPSVDVTEAATSMKATRKAKVDGTTIVEDVTFSLPTGVVGPEQFEKFTAAAREIDDGFQTVFRVSPPAGAAIVESIKAGQKAPDKKAEKKPAPPPKKP